MPPTPIATFVDAPHAPHAPRAPHAVAPGGARHASESDSTAFHARSFAETLDRLLAGEHLDPGEMEHVMGLVLDGVATPAQIAGFAVALRAKGERPEEIASAARALRARMKRLAPKTQPDADGRDVAVLDTCGTGGDGAASFNVSTVAAIVVAAAGVLVAKHGNRAVSSRSGSADLLEALDVQVAPSANDEASEATFDARIHAAFDDANIAFLFAPRHHAALRHAAGVRRELGVRTMFNLLGPLANPASATHQLLGVFDDRWRRPLAEVLRTLGLRGAWVVHGEACEGAPRGLDEVSPSGATRLTQLDAAGALVERTIVPEDARLDRVAIATLRGGDATENAAIARALLAGERDGAAHGPRVAVVLNAACALVVAGVTGDLFEARLRAEEAIDSGRARTTLARWAAIMNGGALSGTGTREARR